MKIVDRMFLYDSGTKSAYANLQELETHSKSQSTIYCYFNDFLAMTKSN